ncbi:uncharacterized protein LOC113561506 isoform X2 [Ooceraea biroi]|uniref:uncharacterized protein LOC105285445 isoform X2 n=1 Tax=Ooceraea biroi TaxID=2015173 RepID=UPI000F083497|nr:uncharacterized protein LOC105285445 isoform X2 [Ooceraea biroi]XP_026824169.1 uncharacterized protein LOC113561506 isoform X2 [Ooceraea biroi]
MREKEILRRQTISLPSLRNPAKNPLHCTDQMYKRDRVHHNFSKKLWNHLTKKIDALQKLRYIIQRKQPSCKTEYSGVHNRVEHCSRHD